MTGMVGVLGINFSAWPSTTSLAAAAAAVACCWSVAIVIGSIPSLSPSPLLCGCHCLCLLCCHCRCRVCCCFHCAVVVSVFPFFPSSSPSPPSLLPSPPHVSISSVVITILSSQPMLSLLLLLLPLSPFPPSSLSPSVVVSSTVSVNVSIANDVLLFCCRYRHLCRCHHRRLPPSPSWSCLTLLLVVIAVVIVVAVATSLCRLLKVLYHYLLDARGGGNNDANAVSPHRLLARRLIVL